MSGELRKPRTLMRLRCWLGRLLTNVSAGWNNGIAKHALYVAHLPGGLIRPQHLSSKGERTHMNVIIQKLNGLWHLIVGSCQIRTPFLETQDRALVVAYARRIYPGAKIIERG